MKLEMKCDHRMEVYISIPQSFFSLKIRKLFSSFLSLIDLSPHATNAEGSDRDIYESVHDMSNFPMGYKILPRVSSTSSEWPEKLKGIPTSWVSDSLGRCVGTTGLVIFHGRLDIMIAAPALTVKTRPGDNLMIHKALELANEGDAIVIDGGGDMTQALVGGNMQATAIRKRIAGFIVDGAIRDLADWGTGEVGIWARGHTPRGPTKDGPGEINVPVSVGGMIVNPGDIILGDADGIVAIRPDQIPSLWPEILRQQAKELRVREENQSGNEDRERINNILRQKGLEI